MRTPIYDQVFDLLNFEGTVDCIYNWDYPKTFQKERLEVFELLREHEIQYPTYSERWDHSTSVKVEKGAFCRTLEYSSYSFYGNLVNERPSGLGILYDNIGYFVGKFKNGSPNGYGIRFDLDGNILWESEDVSFDGKSFYANGHSITYHNYDMVDKKRTSPASGLERWNYNNAYTYETEYYDTLLDDEAYEIFDSNYGHMGGFMISEHIIYRPCVAYEGNMKKSERSGTGNAYYDIFVYDQDEERYCLSSLSCYGSLQISGEFEKDRVSGKAVLYYENGFAQYVGEFKNGKAHGKGTLYNEDGTVNHKGKFKKGDIV